jgi:hypothetical protein
MHGSTSRSNVQCYQCCIYNQRFDSLTCDSKVPLRGINENGFSKHKMRCLHRIIARAPLHNCRAPVLIRARKDSFRKLDLSAVAIEWGGEKIDILLKDYPARRWTIGSKASRAHANVVSEMKKGIALIAERIPASRWKSGQKQLSYL